MNFILIWNIIFKEVVVHRFEYWHFTGRRMKMSQIAYYSSAQENCRATFQFKNKAQFIYFNKGKQKTCSFKYWLIHQLIYRLNKYINNIIYFTEGNILCEK